MSKRTAKIAFEKGYRPTLEGEILSPQKRKRKLHSDKWRYLSFGISTGTKIEKVYVHQLVAYIKYGDDIFDPNIEVRHMDGDPQSNIWENIEIGSSHDNKMDIPPKERKRRAKVAAGFRRRLTNKEVESLRLDRQRGMSYKELMAKYSLAKSTISYIINNKTYKSE